MKTFRSTALLAIAVTLLTATVYASEYSPTRGKLDLDGVWAFATDPSGVGETQGWQGATATLPIEQPEGYAPATPGKIQVPGIWDAQGYGAPTDKVKHNYVGKAWYQRRVAVPANWDSDNNIVLVLGGISRSAKVWIDGKQVGSEVVGCIGSHEFDVTPYVAPGQTVTLTIRVDSSQNWAVDPLLGAASLNDYLEIKWGGLWGHVYLESRPKVRLDSIYLRTKLRYDKNNNIASAYAMVDATIVDENKSEAFDGSVRFTLFDQYDNRVATAFTNLSKLDLSSGQAKASLWMAVPHAKLWTPDSPNLYRARVELFPQSSRECDALESTYGMREIKFEKNRIYLNGKPFFLRGYGDDHIYPLEFSMPTDGQMYRDRLTRIKAFGFNHCRHHSCVLPHEYYDACDELGMFPNAEMLLGYPQQLPGEGDLWKRNVPEGTDPTPALETLKERWAAVVKEYRNHPSIFIWVGGNELCMLNWDRWNAMPLGSEFYAIAKELDPDRYFTDCDGDWLNEYATRGGRGPQDFYSVLFDEWSNPVLNQEKFKTSVEFDKPVVSHESGNFLTFSRQDQVELFKNSNYKPFWMVDGKAKLEELGLADEVEDWAKASERLYLLAHKYNVEGVRRNDALSGYHWWLIQDYWTTSNGIFDLFFRPKSLKPADILPFNNDLVLVQEGFQFSYTEGDKVFVTPMISNFAPTSKQGVLQWSLTYDDLGVLPDFLNSKPSPSGTIQAVVAPNGKLTTLKPIEFAAPKTATPTQATLRLTFKASDDTTYVNTWTTTVFPNVIVPKTTKPIYADETAIQYFPRDWNVQPLSSLTDELPADAIYAIAWATPSVIDAVQRGAGAIHFGASQFLGALPVRFQQTWWKAGDSEEQNNTGTYVYDNAITNGVVDARFCGAAWASLLDGAQKYNIETSQPRPEVFIRALSSLVRVRDAAILFELGCGKGKIVVSGLNHEKTLELLAEPAAVAGPEIAPEQPVAPANAAEPVATVTPVAPAEAVAPVAPAAPVAPVAEVEPVVPHSAATAQGLSPLSRWLLAGMLDEAGNGVAAKASWDPQTIVPPVKVPAGMTLGVERVLQFAETNVWNSYREMTQSVPFWICRQDKLGAELVWRTAPAIVETPAATTAAEATPAPTAEATPTAEPAPATTAAETATTAEAAPATATFVFAGALGYATMPKTPGFQLTFNDALTLNFDVPELFDGTKTFTWTSEDGAMTLTLDARSELPPNDKYGLFKLTVPVSALAPGQAQTICVKSLGQDSRRWFGINLYTDLSDAE